MTRTEHIKWCKERAIKEYDYYIKDGASVAQRNGLASIMSDLNKHPETNSPTLQSLIVMNMTIPMTRQKFVDFINGFN